MEIYIPDENGHIDLEGNLATYPPGYQVYFLHGQFAGMEKPPAQEQEPQQPLQGNAEMVIPAQASPDLL